MKDRQKRKFRFRAGLGFCLLSALFLLLGGRTSSVWASDREVESITLGEPAYVWWESNVVGKWSTVKKAHEYQVKLYISDYVERDEENWRILTAEEEESELEAVAVVRTSENSFDFSPYMEDGHIYFFAVRAVPKVNEQAYVTAGEWVASKDADLRQEMVMGITEGTWRNYLEGSRYEDGEGVFLTGGWHLIQGSWYFLDENGYRMTGWQEIGGKRYYLGDEGRMAVGWFMHGDQWYYADKEGEIQTGWIMDVPGEYYYLDEEGRMLCNTVIDGWKLGADGMALAKNMEAQEGGSR